MQPTKVRPRPGPAGVRPVIPPPTVKLPSAGTSPSSATPPSAAVQQDASHEAMRERYVFMCMSLIGQHVEARVLGGAVFEGLLHAAVPAQNGTSVVLHQAILRGDQTDAPRTIIIEAKTLLSVTAKSVDLDRLAKVVDRAGFQTDSSIGAISGTRGDRELVAWQADENDAIETLEELGDGASWNQFEENERRFGVTTTFKEELYTTALDRSAPDFAEKEKQAEALAREIERQSTGNIHLAEERGAVPDMNEEDLYGAVIRPATENSNKQAASPGAQSNKYVVPAQRAKAGFPVPTAGAKSSEIDKLEQALNSDIYHFKEKDKKIVSDRQTHLREAEKRSFKQDSTNIGRRLSATLGPAMAQSPVASSPTEESAKAVAGQAPAPVASTTQKAGESIPAEATDTAAAKPAPTFKFNPNAKVYKFNASAKPFSPAAPTAATTSAAPPVAPAETTQHHKHDFLPAFKRKDIVNDAPKTESFRRTTQRAFMPSADLREEQQWRHGNISLHKMIPPPVMAPPMMPVGMMPFAPGVVPPVVPYMDESGYPGFPPPQQWVIVPPSYGYPPVPGPNVGMPPPMFFPMEHQPVYPPYEGGRVMRTMPPPRQPPNQHPPPP